MTQQNTSIILETERLILRTWSEYDVDAYYQINQDEKVTEFLLIMPTIEQVKTFIHDMNKQYKELNYTLFATVEKSSNTLIGFIGLNPPKWESHFTPCVEIGWRLGSKYWGKGYATEGAKAVLAYGFEQCRLDEIVSFTVAENIRSKRVMEKLGLKHINDDDFNHPLVPSDHKLLKHVLYRINRQEYMKIISNVNI